MIQNLLTYVFTDIFYQLWMVPAHLHNVGGDMSGFQKKDWSPELIEGMDPDEIPDIVTVKGDFRHLNNKGAFHLGRNSPSLGFDEMAITWGKNIYQGLPLSRPMWNVGSLHRENGPAEIVLTDVKKWHHDGELHRRRGDAVICKQAKITWAKNDSSTRENGPHQIVLKNISAKATNGQIRDIHYLSHSYAWSTHNQQRIPSQTANKIIEKCKLKVNLLATDSIFTNEEDEFIFLTELGD